MKSIIKNALVLSTIAVVIVEFYIFMGGKLKVPLSNHIDTYWGYWSNIIVEFIILFVFIVFLLYLAKKNDKRIKKEERADVLQPHDDPILNKIIEDALNGKKATEDSESEVDNTEKVEKEESDVKI